MRRKAERKWCSSNSTHDLKEYKSERNVSTNLIKIARSDFCENLIQETSSDQGKLFKISKQLLNQSFEVPFHPHVSKSMLANEMANFFVEKISNIRSLNSMSVQFRIVKIVPPSWNYILRHLVALKQLQKMKLKALS